MSTITPSLRRRSSSLPSSMTGGPPISVASSRPIDVAGLESAVLQARLEQALVQRHGPLHALDAAHAVQLGVLQRLDVVDELHLGVHDPDVRQAEVGDEAVGAGHQADEDGRLLGDEQGGEGQPHDDAQVLAAVADQHFQGDVIHGSIPLALPASSLKPAREKRAMWPAQRSISAELAMISGQVRSMTERECLNTRHWPRMPRMQR